MNTQWAFLKEVESSSRPGVFYRVARNEKTGVIGCSCRGWINNRTCKHIAGVSELIDRMRQRALADEEIEVGHAILNKANREAVLAVAEIESEHDKPELNLVGQDGNAFNVLGLARRAAKRAGWAQEKIDVFLKEAMSGNYDHLLQTCMKHFDVS